VKKKLKFIDLFCGIGGFRSALDALGHKCVFSSDNDPHAQETYALNYNEVPDGDITKVSAQTIPSHNVLCGGFPCQPFSISGKRKGFEDARGTLLYEVLRIAGFHKPEILFLENVKNYVSHNQGKTLETTLRLIDGIGYDTHHSVVNASLYGVPQKRERIYFICFRKDLGIKKFNFPEPTNEDIAIEDILLPSHDRRLEELVTDRKDITYKNGVKVERSLKPIRLGTLSKGGQGERIYSPKGHAITLSAYGGGIGAKTGLYLINGKVRRLHPEECKLAMSFPADFKVHPNRNTCFKQFGNAVAVKVIKAIFEKAQNELAKVD
jgi:DNA (cytosine-5)-methyltransferase 1